MRIGSHDSLLLTRLDSLDEGASGFLLCSNVSHAPEEGFRDEEVIIITRGGLWLADGQEITHEPTRKLFARSLKKDSQGYFLSIGRETKRIQVEDTAYFVTRIEGSSASGWMVFLNDETH